MSTFKQSQDTLTQMNYINYRRKGKGKRKCSSLLQTTETATRSKVSPLCAVCKTPRKRPCDLCSGDKAIWEQEKQMVRKEKPRQKVDQLTFMTKSGRQYQKVIKKSVVQGRVQYPYRKQ